MSRVHVSSRSGGWRIDGSACPQPERGGREEEEEEVEWEEDREEGRGRRERLSAEKQAGRELAGSGCT